MPSGHVYTVVKWDDGIITRFGCGLLHCLSNQGGVFCGYCTFSTPYARVVTLSLPLSHMGGSPVQHGTDGLKSSVAVSADVTGCPIGLGRLNRQLGFEFLTDAP